MENCTVHTYIRLVGEGKFSILPPALPWNFALIELNILIVGDDFISAQQIRNWQLTTGWLLAGWLATICPRCLVTTLKHTDGSCSPPYPPFLNSFIPIFFFDVINSLLYIPSVCDALSTRRCSTNFYSVLCVSWTFPLAPALGPDHWMTLGMNMVTRWKRW